MADDIDIEEHDVLDNPRIKNIFPDLSRIKTEMPDPELEEYDIEEDCEDFNNYQLLQAESVEHSDSQGFATPDDIVYTQSSNKMIIGSKPNQEDSSDEWTSSEQSYDGLEPIVLLEDWGPRLETSKCYCSECKILFATVNALDAHKMAVHSFLIALENVSNKAVKSTAKSDENSRHTAMKSTGILSNEAGTSKRKVPGESRLCNHCNEHFPNDTSLVKHLYELLPGNNYNCDKSDVLDNSLKISHDDMRMYKCEICSYYFKSIKGLRLHCNNNHKIISLFGINPLRFKNKCEHCSQCFNSVYNFNAHIKQNHYSIWKKAVKYQPQSYKCSKVIASEHNKKFKCVLCHEILSSYYSARIHRAVKHKDARNNVIFKRVTNKNSSGMKSEICPIARHKRDVKIKTDVMYALSKRRTIKNAPFPKSILFKCSKCPLHFLTCYTAIRHALLCPVTRSNQLHWKCGDCRRVFKNNDRVPHELQHNFVAENFKVYVVYSGLLSKIICKCPHCELHFDEFHFWKHVDATCDADKTFDASVDCIDCDLAIHTSSVATHAKHHKYDKYKAKDFIVMEFVSMKQAIDCLTKKQSKDGPKRKHSDIDTDTDDMSPKKQKLDTKKILKMYYCSSCCCYINHSSHINGHYLKCGKSDRQMCSECGLVFSPKSLLMHVKTHKELKNLQLSDIKFMRVRDNKTICPPMPAFPKCVKCKVHYVGGTMMKKHYCNTTKHKTCEICKMKFNDIAYKLHSAFHEYGGRSRASGEGSGSKVMPELMKKYESLEDMWNVLFMCRTCESVTDSYDSVVEHCQDHHNGVFKSFVFLKKCHTCKLTFDKNCYQKHEQLHSINNSIKKTSFKILGYKYTSLLTQNWYKMFDCLPEEQKQQIISRSIYVETRSVKFRILADGPPELTLYKCETCQRHVQSTAVEKHVQSTGCFRLLSWNPCPECNILFFTPKARDIHKVLHEDAELDEGSFRVVGFNKKSDREFNMALLNQQRPYKYDDNVVRMNRRSKRKLIFYKCKDCDTCVTYKCSVNKHVCAGDTSRVLCKKCDLYFTPTQIRRHLLMHSKLPQYNKKDTLVVPFSKNNCNNVGNELDSDGNAEDSDVDSHDALLYKAGNNNVLSRLQKKLLFYKCKFCSICMIYKNNVSRHVCSVRDHKAYCQKCDLYFVCSQMPKHKLLHARFPQYNKNNIVVITFELDKSNSKINFDRNMKDSDVEFSAGSINRESCDVEMKVEPKNLFDRNGRRKKNLIFYKCKHCGMCVTYKRNVNKHVCSDGKHKAFCNECGLYFAPMHIKKHRNVHARFPEYRKKNISIILFNANKPKYIGNRLNSDDGTEDSDRESITVYKCKCGLHYDTLKAMEKHSVRCNGSENISKEKCSKCNLTFATDVLVSHLCNRHTEAKTGDFKVVNYIFNNRNILTYKCKICSVHFYTKKALFLHLNSCETNGYGGVECKICGLVFHTSMMALHKMKHKIIDLLRADDHTIVALGKEDKLLERPLSISTMVERIHSNRTLYKCKSCAIHYLKLKSLKYHFEVNHKTLVNLVPCSSCGLLFTGASLKKHVEFHHSQLGYSLNDFHIAEMSSGSLSSIRIIRKQMFAYDTEKSKINEERRIHSVYSDRTLYKCKSCNIHYMNVKSLQYHFEMKHKNLRNLMPCSSCGLIFTSMSLKNHVKFHHSQLGYSLDDLYITEINSEKFFACGTNSKKSIVNESSRSEIIDKVEIASVEDNVLYKCDKCELHFLKDDSLTLHVVNNCEEDSPEICEVCGLKFPVRLMREHAKLHHEKYSFSVKDYDIRVRAEEHNVSIYDNNKSVEPSRGSDARKCRFKRDLFKCKSCHVHYLNVESLKYHFVVNHKSTIDFMSCEFCGLKFTKISLKKHVYLHHTKLSCDLEDFNFIELDSEHTIVEKTNIQTSKAVDVRVESKSEKSQLIYEEVESESNGIEVIDNVVKVKDNDNIIYKCVKCESHFLTEDLLTVHMESNCEGDSPEVCDKCDLKFPAQVMEQHVELHHRKHSFSLKDYDITVGVGKLKEESTNFRGKAISDKVLSAINVDLYSNKLYKCEKCCLHFLKMLSLYKHMSLKRHGSVEKSRCRSCGLMFSTSTLPRHEYIQHEKLKLKLEDFKIIIDYKSHVTTNTDDASVESVESSINLDGSTVDIGDDRVDDSTVSAEDGVSKSSKVICSDKDVEKTENDHTNKYTVKLYKCGECNVCFLTQSSCYKHTTKHTPLDPKEYIECKLCSLQFKYGSLPAHIKKHHEKELKLDEILIEEYKIASNSNVPVIELYSAIDKVQSRLVSTTTDFGKGTNLKTQNFNENNNSKENTVSSIDDIIVDNASPAKDAIYFNDETSVKDINVEFKINGVDHVEVDASYKFDINVNSEDIRNDNHEVTKKQTDYISSGVTEVDTVNDTIEKKEIETEKNYIMKS